MKSRVLFLDDEQSLLNGIQRRLGFDYEMTCCTSGEEALKVIEEVGPFAVIVTDMRMPHMNGVQFIRRARMISPESVYLMLTGNQDQATVVQAMNEGQVFRFLTKPCDHDALRRCLDSALYQYRLVTAEKELLQRTFVEAVGVLTEVLEISQPEIYSQASHIEELMEILAKPLGISIRWEYRLSARLSLLGLTFLTDEERALLKVGSPATDRFQEIHHRAASISCRLIEKIPRLQTVSRIVALSCESNGRINFEVKDGPMAITEIGSALLRAATIWNSMSRSGLGVEASLKQIQAVMPELCPKMVSTLKHLCLNCGQQEKIAVGIDDLCEGLILAEDVVASDGTILMQQGRRLSWATVEKLRMHHVTFEPLKPIAIVVNSFEDAPMLT